MIYLIRSEYPKHTKNSYKSTSKTNKKENSIKAETLNRYFSGERHINCQQTHEKMPNKTNHWRNTNQNHNETAPYTCENDYHQKDNK